ncbi:YihY/virulence factor BrkB family protein [Pelagicoccus sp. SDUM812002]|nr:YihY/virulence factor BrkB family protein [Pelagicoccus sp. SDUM812002]
MADGTPRLSAAVAFYTALSLAPLLTVVITILGFVLGDEAARGLLANEIANVTDRESAEFIQSIISNAEGWGSGLLGGLLSGAVLLWGATRLFYEIQEALDMIWNARGDGNSIKVALTRRIIALGMCLVVAFLLLVSLGLHTALAYVVDSVRVDLPGEDWLWLIVGFVTSFAVVAALFAALYKWLPTVEVSWRIAFWSAVVAAGLFGLGRDAFSIYLSRQDDLKGAAGSLIVVLLWVYFSAQVFFVGAEVGKVIKSRAED